MLQPHPFLFFVVLLPCFAVVTAGAMSAYDVLSSNGLPMGLLPKGVKDFDVDVNGNFEARLDAPCTAKFESEVRYNATVAGTISLGQIAGLSGISAQDLFLWFPVRAIRLDNYTSGIIHFDVGVVDKRYPLSLFEVPPDCAPVSPSSSHAKSKEGTNMALLVSKSQSGELPYELDQDDAPRASI